MKFYRDPVKVGTGIFFLVLVSVIVILAGFWDALGARQKATVAIGGVGALGTATLALATFWTIRQNEQTLENLEKERQKPVILDMLAEVVNPIIEKTEKNKDRLSTGQNVWAINSREGDFDTVNILMPPSYNNIEVSTWHEFKEGYSDLYSECERWFELIRDLSNAAEELAEALYEAEQYDEISNRSRAVRTIMDATRYTEDTDQPVGDVEEYRRTMYQNYPELHHQYWRKQWELLKVIRELRSETIEMKRELQAEYGISNKEIKEHQNTL